MTPAQRNRQPGTDTTTPHVQHHVSRRIPIRLLFIAVVAPSLVACGSSHGTPRAAEPSPSSITTVSIVAPSDSAVTGTAIALPGSTVVPGRATTTPTTATSGLLPTTTVPTLLPVDGTAVRGRVTAGPTCPVERPDQPCPPNPVSGRVDALDRTGHAAANARTDDAGRYAISLPPGRYTLRVAVDGPFPHCPDVAVSVTASAPVTADISCDTGIR
jgi:hypothetical protein